MPYSVKPLSFQVEENLEKYKEGFDIVIVEDESLDVINGIIDCMLDHQN